MSESVVAPLTQADSIIIEKMFVLIAFRVSSGLIFEVHFGISKMSHR
jgi:hypothetical protein